MEHASHHALVQQEECQVVYKMDVIVKEAMNVCLLTALSMLAQVIRI